MRCSAEREWLALLAAAPLPLPLLAAAAAQLAVEVVNASVPTLCAETDNVYLKLISGEVRRFTSRRSTRPMLAPSWSTARRPISATATCRSDHAYQSVPRRVTLWETEDWQLVGHTLATFWRPNAVPVRVDDRVETGLHLIQLWHRFRERTEEVLVLYPADGYWRARPLPPPHLRCTAYGSSFLVGPVETQGRPFVDINEIASTRRRRTFRLAFARGGHGHAAARGGRPGAHRARDRPRPGRHGGRRSRRCARCS